MIKSNLLKLLKSFQKQEQRELALFIESVHHHKQKKVIQLYHYILDALDKSLLLLTKPQIAQHLFPREAYNEKKIRYLISFLNKRYQIKRHLDYSPSWSR